ncbi:MAG TPA: NAD(P)-dependent oxidoreductase [Pseudonocardiaceae bacterium]
MTDMVLVTGAAGRIGGFLRPRLRAAGHELRLLDVVPTDGEPDALVASVTDLDAMRAACAGAAAVVHLGGLAGDEPWDRVLDTNIHGTWCVLEAARLAGVPRVVLASSNHAVGFVERGDGPAPDDLAPRPDTFYGVSKVTMEALGSLYADRFGLHVVALRIGTCAPEPRDTRALATWLSPDDAGRLVHAALTVPGPGFRVVWGVSANTRRWWSTAGGEAIGYHPLDDAEAYAADFPPAPEPPVVRVGGPWARTEP